MNRDILKPLIVYLACVIITFACNGYAANIDESKLKEVLSLTAVLAAAVSMLPLFLIITQHWLFENLALPLKSKPKTLPPSSRSGVVFSVIIIGGLSFILFFMLGSGLFPLPEYIHRFTTGNSFIIWLLFLTVITFFTLRSWLFWGHGRKAEWTLSDLGLEGHNEKDLKIIRPANRSKRIIPHAIIAAVILTVSVLILLLINLVIFKNGSNFLTLLGFEQFNILRFLIYLAVFAVFFTVVGGAKLYGQMRLHQYKLNRKKSTAFTQFAWWCFSVIVMLGGLLFAALIEYIMSSRGYNPTFGNMSAFIFFIFPLFAVFLFFSTWFYRRSGTVYTGSFVLAILGALVFACIPVF